MIYTYITSTREHTANLSLRHSYQPKSRHVDVSFEAKPLKQCSY